MPFPPEFIISVRHISVFSVPGSCLIGTAEAYIGGGGGIKDRSRAGFSRDEDT